MDAMSDAIEGADVMLYGVSLRYKESANVSQAAVCMVTVRTEPVRVWLTHCICAAVWQCRMVRVGRGAFAAQLSVVLTEFIDKLDNILGQATDSVESQPAKIRARLKDQIEQVIKDASQVDAVRLEQEIAILMTKADIREELDRLRAHIISVRELMSTGGAVGRRLDFLCQELNREANTICSKAHETALTRIGLDMKATIEQFREQVQNIE